MSQFPGRAPRMQIAARRSRVSRRWLSFLAMVTSNVSHLASAALVAALVAAAGALASCGGDLKPTTAPHSPNQPPTTTQRETTTRRPAAAKLTPAHCPTTLTDCVTATGRIAYVERVDPDGDGDAHFVLLSGEGITAPGITIVDVRRDLRPDPLPGVGDELSAAGPVYPGSHGQRQIEAVVVNVAR